MGRAWESLGWSLAKCQTVTESRSEWPAAWQLFKFSRSERTQRAKHAKLPALQLRNPCPASRLAALLHLTRGVYKMLGALLFQFCCCCCTYGMGAIKLECCSRQCRTRRYPGLTSIHTDRRIAVQPDEPEFIEPARRPYQEYIYFVA